MAKRSRALAESLRKAFEFRLDVDVSVHRCRVFGLLLGDMKAENCGDMKVLTLDSASGPSP